VRFRLDTWATRRLEVRLLSIVCRLPFYHEVSRKKDDATWLRGECVWKNQEKFFRWVDYSPNVSSKALSLKVALEEAWLIRNKLCFERWCRKSELKLAVVHERFGESLCFFS
jgi:hypothetical protein